MYQALFARQGLSLDRLRTFLEVVDAGAIALAAPGDPIRQSQYSRQLAELEEFFGRDLFVRRGRSRQITPAGEQLARVAREAFQGLGDIAAEAGRQLASFALGAGDSLLHGLVIPRLGRVLAGFPEVQVSVVGLTGRDILARLDDGRLDFGILRAPEVPRGLGSAALGTVEYQLFVPRRLRARGLAAPLALQQSEPQLNGRLLDWAQRHGVSLDVRVVCETFPQAVRAVQSGHYASLLPTFTRGEFSKGEVEEVAPPGLAPAATRISLAWLRRTLRVRPGAPRLASALAAMLQTD